MGWALDCIGVKMGSSAGILQQPRDSRDKVDKDRQLIGADFQPLRLESSIHCRSVMDNALLLVRIVACDDGQGRLRSA
jgi:hypothetical protein